MKVAPKICIDHNSHEHPKKFIENDIQKYEKKAFSYRRKNQIIQ
jgi:hypothetical protein